MPAIETIRYGIIARILPVFGRACVKVGDYTEETITKTINTIEISGGKYCGRDEMPTFDGASLYFRIAGRRVRLSYEDYGDVVLWGPRKVVLELSKRIKADLLQEPTK